MLTRMSRGAALLILVVSLTCLAAGQSPLQLHQGGSNYDSLTPNALTSSALMSMDLWSVTNAGHSPLEGRSGSVSKLDLKAPGKAQREYDKGYALLMRKDYKGAIEHLTVAITVYPDYVAAHNALGSAYLALNQNNEARDQFAKAVLLDDHLPSSFLNLGCSQLALKDYRSAEDSVKKASSLAPLDLQLAMALTYTQYMNQDYGPLLETVRQVHSRKHDGAAMVHFYAAAALDSQNKTQEEQNELRTLLQEDPKSPAAEQSRQLLAQIKLEEIRKEAQKKETPEPAPVAAAVPDPQAIEAQRVAAVERVAAQRQMALQDAAEQKQVAEAEAEPERCTTCPANTLPSEADSGAQAKSSSKSYNPFTLRSVVDEVAVFFAATDHGRSVTDLTREEVGIRDDRKSPAAITGFRNEDQLPLRLGIVIDTSDSVTERFAFEQRAAVDFLQKVLNNKDDLGFVVGVANSVLLVQDFTNDRQRIAQAIDKLAPAGGTALWDAVAFAADKLGGRTETQPVARMLVVISDGKDNSSSVSLKDAIDSAERGEVLVYTVSTREANDSGDSIVSDDRALVGDRALKVMAEHTGGANFVPGSVSGLNRGLEELQQVIRSRYLISYKPALFKADGQYHAIDITAQKSGHKLRVYSRKGYYAHVTPTPQNAVVSE